MAETAGLVIGAVGLAALFDSCMSAFQYVESAKHFGVEYQKTAFQISLLQLRLSRWAQPITFVETIPTSPTHVQVATLDEVEQVEYLLGEIYAGFEDAERASRAYKMKIPLPDQTAEEGSTTVDMLIERVRKISLHRQRQSSIKQKTLWALHDGRKFKRLVEGLAENITNLEKLFPVLRSSQERLVASDVGELIQPSEIEEPADGELSVKEIMEEAAVDVDALLNEAISKIAASPATLHTFRNTSTTDGAHAAFGDYVAKGSKRDQGYTSTYNNVRASGKGTQVHYGNNFGGPHVFSGNEEQPH